MSKTPKVTLVNGEKVKLEIKSVANQVQTFIRISVKLIAGIINTPDWHGIYIWCEVNGVYQYLGDIVFTENEDSSVTWHVVPSVPRKIREKAALFFQEQIKCFHPKTDSPGVKLLSQP